MYDNDLYAISGKRIRNQFLCMFFYGTAYLSACLLISETIRHFRGRTEMDIRDTLVVTTLFVLVTFGMAIINRYLFGPVVAVLNERGLHTADASIPWENIESMTYTFCKRNKKEFSFRTNGRWFLLCAVVHTGHTEESESAIIVRNAPLRLLKLCKKRNSAIHIQVDKSLYLLLIIPLVLTIRIVWNAAFG